MNCYAIRQFKLDKCLKVRVEAGQLSLAPGDNGLLPVLVEDNGLLAVDLHVSLRRRGRCVF